MYLPFHLVPVAFPGEERKGDGIWRERQSSNVPSSKCPHILQPLPPFLSPPSPAPLHPSPSSLLWSPGSHSTAICSPPFLTPLLSSLPSLNLELSPAFPKETSIPLCPTGSQRPSNPTPQSPDEGTSDLTLTHPLLFSDSFPQEDAGGAHGELHGGAGRSSRGAGHQSQDGSLLPGPSMAQPLYLFYHSFANSSCSPCQSCDSWGGNHRGCRGIRAAPASPSGFSETGGAASLRL